MKIIDNIEIVDLGLYLRKDRTLIITDVHMGYEEALNKEGILVPRFQLKETLNRLEKIFDKIEVNTMIINGDLKHEFGVISETEWRHTLRLLDFLSEHCKKIILIKGNHDTILGPIAEKRDLEIKDYHRINDIFICHGHKIFSNLDFSQSKIIIIGNEHCAIGLRKNKREEIFKCFLVGKFKNKKLIALPSFNLVVEGSNISREEILSPYLNQDLNNFDVYVVENKIYFFGKFQNLKNL